MKGLMITPNSRNNGTFDITLDGTIQNCLGKDEVLGFVASVLFTGKPLFAPSPVPQIECQRTMREAIYIGEIMKLRRQIKKLNEVF